MSAGSLGLEHWRPREPPLEATLALGSGAVGLALARRVLRHDTLAGLSAVVTDEALLIAGSELPWVEGIAYFGRSAAAPSVLQPTTLEPPLDEALLERRLLAELAPPVLIDPRRGLLVSLRELRALDRAKLRAWLERGEAHDGATA